MLILELHLKMCPIYKMHNSHKRWTHVGGADNLDIIMPMYNLTEYSDNYSETSDQIWTMGNLLMLLQMIHHPLNTNQVSWNN